MKRYKDIGQAMWNALRETLGAQGLLIGPMRLMGLIALIGLMGLLGSCSKDSPEQRGEMVQLELIPYYNIYKESEAGTRAEPIEPTFNTPSGYVSYADLNRQADPTQSTIHVFLTTTSATANKIETEGNFTFRPTYYTAEEATAYNETNNLQPSDADYKQAGDIKSSRWTSGVWMSKDINDYYVYGYMPASIRNVQLSPNQGTYANKAVLYLPNLSAITPADLCIIVGVKGWTEPHHPTIANSGIKIGEFAYHSSENYKEGDPATGGNYIYLLLDHLYTCLDFEYLVGNEYSQLRTIKLRKVEMTLEGLRYNVTVTIDGSECTTVYEEIPNSTSLQTAKAFDRTQSTEGTTIPTWENNESKGLRVPGYFTPKVSGNFTLKSTYDVYDKKGNLIRASQTAENLITPANLNIVGEHSHEAGKVHTLKLIIEPTYLYQLSDGDLNNPTVKVKAGS